MARKIIFDTDPGIDDAMALRLIQRSNVLDLVGITTVFGNANVATTTRNARYLAGLFGIDVPVAMGAADPIASVRRPEPAHVHGADGLGDIALPPAPHAAIDPRSARDFLIETIRAAPGEISVIAVAPLTNLALALDAAPDIADKLGELIVMGGAFGGGTRRGNVSPVAEANIINDPHAADRVLGARWPVTMVGLDVTTRCILDDDRARRLVTEGGAIGRFLWDISRDYAAMYARADGFDGCCLHDVAAVACAIDPALFGTVGGPIRVVTEGIAVGQTIQQPDGQYFPPGAWDGLPSQRAAVTVNAEAVVELFLRHMCEAV
jgi:purine nucleosidase